MAGGVLGCSWCRVGLVGFGLGWFAGFDGCRVGTSSPLGAFMTRGGRASLGWVQVGCQVRWTLKQRKNPLFAHCQSFTTQISGAQNRLTGAQATGSSNVFLFKFVMLRPPSLMWVVGWYSYSFLFRYSEVSFYGFHCGLLLLACLAQNDFCLPFLPKLGPPVFRWALPRSMCPRPRRWRLVGSIRSSRLSFIILVYPRFGPKSGLDWVGLILSWAPTHFFGTNSNMEIETLVGIGQKTDPRLFHK